MKALALLLVLVSACVSGEDQSNCVPTACGGCCGVGGKCEAGTKDRACGSAARACIDCTLASQRCDELTQACTSLAPCEVGRCNTGSGTATPCCPLAFPCASGTSCFGRMNPPPGSSCCR